MYRSWHVVLGVAAACLAGGPESKGPGLALAGEPAAAESTGGAADQAALVRQILERANAAAAKIQTIAYKVKTTGDGAAVRMLPVVSGSVVARRNGRAPSAYSVKGRSADDRTFLYASDGETTHIIDERSKTYSTVAAGRMPPVEVLAMFPPKYMEDGAFSYELTLSAASYEGTEKVEGVDCHVVRVAYDPEGRWTTTFYFGKDDHLMRRYDRVMTPLSTDAGRAEATMAGTYQFVVSDLQADPQVDEAAFRPPCPPGFKTVAAPEVRSAVAPNGLLAVGSEAPDWELQTPEGQTVTLKSLRGKVVVLDFWASWCGPCKMAMPGLQRLHERYKDKPVAIYGVDHGERYPFDVAAFMKKNKYTYGQLVKGDKVAMAYRVRSIPCLYVIGPDGKIVHASVGFNPAMERELATVIEKALPKQRDAAGAAP